MKRLIAAAILFCFVITAYLTGYFYVQKTCDEAKAMLNTCVDEYKAEKNAEASAEKLEKFWQKKEKALSLFADHDEIDEIERVISSLRVYSGTDSEELFAEYSGTVEILLHQMIEDTEPSIHSIF